MSGVILMLVLAAITAASYFLTAMLLRRLSVEAPETFAELGQPGFWELFSRNPSHWAKQFRFLGFILSGLAYRRVPETLRTLTTCVWLTQASTILWLIYFIYLAVAGKLPD